jgi:hypothetical protein
MALEIGLTGHEGRFMLGQAEYMEGVSMSVWQIGGCVGVFFLLLWCPGCGVDGSSDGSLTAGEGENGFDGGRTGKNHEKEGLPPITGPESCPEKLISDPEMGCTDFDSMPCIGTFSCTIPIDYCSCSPCAQEFNCVEYDTSCTCTDGVMVCSHVCPTEKVWAERTSCIAQCQADDDCLEGQRCESCLCHDVTP